MTIEENASISYQYTHVDFIASNIAWNSSGQYIHSGVLIGNYGLIGAVGDELHVDTVRVDQAQRQYSEPPVGNVSEYQE